MVTRILFASFVLFATLSLAQEAGNQGVNEVNKRELEKLQGAWLFETPDGRKSVYTFKGNEYAINDDPTYKIKVSIDATIEPIKFTWVAPDGTPPRLGIIKIDGDTVTLCSAFDGSVMPTEFKRKPGFTLKTWKRVKN
jgi:uncharacterized protein (TIGR03067 family)